MYDECVRFAFIDETIMLMLVADIQKLHKIFPQLCVQSFRQNEQYIPAINWQQVSDDMMASTQKGLMVNKTDLWTYFNIIKQKGKHHALTLRKTERRPVPTD